MWWCGLLCRLQWTFVRQLSAIGWILPHTEATERANRRETCLPAERWAQARFNGEMLNDALRERVVELLCRRRLNTEHSAPVEN